MPCLSPNFDTNTNEKDYRSVLRVLLLLWGGVDRQPPSLTMVSSLGRCFRMCSVLWCSPGTVTLTTTGFLCL